jgi:hypothetical protein
MRDRVTPLDAGTGGSAARLRWLALGVGLAAGSYAAYVALAWARHGRARPATDPGADELLDRFMPEYEVGGCHRVRVRAPAAITLAAAREMDLFDSPLVRAIVRARELIVGGTRQDRPRRRGLLDEAQALGWGVLAEAPGRELVVGAVTRPWEADVTFRALPPAEFRAFQEPGWVKIAWTLRADPVGAAESIFTTETRVATTDPASRARFRRYWAFFSPGIVLIRLVSLPLVRRDAERRAREARSASR